MDFEVLTIRRQFPYLEQASPSGSPFVYLDSAATAQKPRAVLDAVRKFEETSTGNVHRGMHPLSERATIAYEGARETVRKFLSAKHADEIVFTKNATEAINLVARSWGKTNLQKGDCVLLSVMEHHSNIVPWLQLKDEIGIELVWLNIEDSGAMNLEQYRGLLEKHPIKLVALTGLSNVLGILPPLTEMIAAAHEAGAKVLVDAAQLVAHRPINVTELDCDFFAFSGHKLYGPTGIGVLYAKRKILNDMPAFLGGGMMIQEVFQDHFTAADPPARFEAGTPPIAQAVGLAVAIEWLQEFSWDDRIAHEEQLLTRAVEQLSTIPGLHLLGPNRNSVAGCLSFTLDGIHPHDLTQILGEQGMCLRAGHHCAQPLHKRLAVTASTRLSVGIYNTTQEIDQVAPAIAEAKRKLAR